MRRKRWRMKRIMRRADVIAAVMSKTTFFTRLEEAREWRRAAAREAEEKPADGWIEEEEEGPPEANESECRGCRGYEAKECRGCLPACLFTCSSMLFTSNVKFRYCWTSCVRL